MHLASYRDTEFTRAVLVNGQASVLNNALQETLYDFFLPAITARQFGTNSRFLTNGTSLGMEPTPRKPFMMLLQIKNTRSTGLRRERLKLV